MGKPEDKPDSRIVSELCRTTKANPDTIRAVLNELGISKHFVEAEKLLGREPKVGDLRIMYRISSSTVIS